MGKRQKKHGKVGGGPRFGLMSRDEYAKQKPVIREDTKRNRERRTDDIEFELFKNRTERKGVPNKPSDIVAERKRRVAKDIEYEKYLQEQRDYQAKFPSATKLEDDQYRR